MSSAPLSRVAVPGWPAAFRGSVAVRAGLVTPAQLRGPNYLRILPDTYVPAADEPPDLALRSCAAYLHSGGRGVLSGYSAAELLGASCGSSEAPAELTVPGGGVRPRAGLLVHRDRLDSDEVQVSAGVPVTTALRTAYDLGRWCGDLTEAVIAIDALANRGRFAPDEVLRLTARYPRARGRTNLPRAVALADARAGSPMESRLRMVLVLRGLPTPEVQYPVLDDRRRRAVWLDLAYPQYRIGIEYEGGEHARPERVLRDVGRYTWLVDDGWRMYRFAKYEVYGEPDEIAAKIGRALERPVR
ncbi:MAG: endonuclease domain-containing protein [Pseudonocardia sp.]